MKSNETESILRSSTRSFFNTMFKVLGFTIGLVPIILIIAGISSYEDDQPDKIYNESVMPNADNKRNVLSSSKPTILEIDIQGLIGTDNLTTERVNRLLVESREGDLKNGLVKAVLLRINTPGGTVIDSDGIYHALKAYKKQYNVPIYAFIDGLCASGGMYIACAADKVYASDVSLTGSVGVVLSSFVNVSKPLEKLGIKTLTVSAGKGKDAMNPLRPWKEDEQENFQFLTDYYYKEFVGIVTSNRPRITREKLVDVYGAKVFPSTVAEEYGFVDFSGKTRRDAILALLEKAEISEDNYQVVALEKKSILSNLFQMKSYLPDGKITHQVQIGPELPPEFANQLLYLYRQ